MIMRAPSYSFNCCSMISIHTNWNLITSTPNKQFVIISSRSKKIIVERPFQSAYFLSMTLKFIAYDITTLSYIPKQNGSISRTTSYHIFRPSNRTYSSCMTCILSQSAVFRSVPKLNCSSTRPNSYLRARLIPINA